MDLQKMITHQRQFAKARDWDQFHTPKNLSMALSVETAELLEIFQWLTEEQSAKIMEEEKQGEAVKHELSDILYYLVRLADVLGVDLEAAFWEKLQLNEKKYPVEQSRGNARKYTEFD